MRLTIQVCTYKRAHLLGRVLDAYFEQNAPADAYEVVLVNDGSPDETPAVIEAARARASCAFTVINQENSGLAKGRNAGIRASRGERIIFTDDDVLPTPRFVEEHLRSDERHGDVIVRGAVINTENFEVLPPPIWTPANYSGNYFWTSNVSVRRSRLDTVGTFFDESFTEYGWEDIELGMRLRAIGTRGVFNKDALAFHFKPPPRGTNIAGLVQQARAQARTAVQLARRHPHWRVHLATGDTAPQRTLFRLLHNVGFAERLAPLRGEDSGERKLSLAQHLAARAIAADAYYEELERARHTH